MTRPIAIVNCRIITPEAAYSSGVALIDGGVIVAAGADRDIAIPANVRLLDAEQGLLQMDGEQGTVQPGKPADLLCISRYGQVQWRMKRGEIIQPAMTSLGDLWRVYRGIAIATVADYLAQRPESRHVQRTDELPGFQRRGIDIVWRFQPRRQPAQSLTIRVIPNLVPQPEHIFVIDGPALAQLPEANLAATRAHWWFYHHLQDEAIYCLPVPPFKRWLQRHAREIPLTQARAAGLNAHLRGRAIPISRLQTDIKKTRIIELVGK